MMGALAQEPKDAIGLDWASPVSLEDARQRRFERDACPAEADDESPNECVFTHGERVEKRARIIEDLRKLARMFVDDCRSKAAEISDDPGDKVVGALDALAKRFEASITASITHLEALDDHALLLLEATVQQYHVAQIRAHVGAFANAYREQVAPIGTQSTRSCALDEGGADLLRAGRETVVRAARIALPGGRRRLALVEHVTDGAAARVLRRAGRGALAVIEDATSDRDDTLITGSAQRVGRDQWVNAPARAVYFVRWIDEARMQALAAEDAIDVAAGNVTDLPLADLAAPAAVDQGGGR